MKKQAYMLVAGTISVPVIILGLLGTVGAEGPLNAEPNKPEIQITADGVRITLLTRNGGRVSWSRGGPGRIAFDRIRRGTWDLWLMDERGQNQTCITCNRDEIQWLDLQGKTIEPPEEAIGQPAWHPDGKHIVIQVASPDHEYACVAEHPGAGQCNELWLMNPDSKKAFQLTNVDEKNPEQGSLHPHFSRDGKKLCWTEMYRQARSRPVHEYAGSWRIYWADFSWNKGRPLLQGIRNHQPGVNTVYECHGFSYEAGTGGVDRLIFSSPFNEKGGPVRRDILTMNLAPPHNVEQLTTESFNEHSPYSPDGKHIVWMSKLNNEGADWWIMASDGSGRRQITFFNRKGHAHYRAFADGPHVTTDLSWARDGRGFVGTVQIPWRFGKGNPEVIVRVDFLQ